MPFYRITIWTRSKRQPITGIRYITQSNIDLATIFLEGRARASFPPHQVIDVEVAMLSKNSKAVQKQLKAILKKSGKLEG